MNAKVLAATLAIAVVALPIARASVPESQPAKAETAKDSPDDRICTSEKTLGSNMKKRVCRTRSQYEAERKAAREEVERAKPPGSTNR